MNALRKAAFESVTRRVARVQRPHVDDRHHPRAGLESLMAPGLVDADARLTLLYQRSVEQTYEDAVQSLRASVALQLVPDEMRILAYATSHSAIPISHAVIGSRLGAQTMRVHSYLSRMPQEAGLMLPDHAPYYLQHLCQLSLLDIGPPLLKSEKEYELIENGLEVRSKVQASRQQWGKKMSFERLSVSVTKLGAQIWEQASNQRYLSQSASRRA
jgi:hypothetical protein